VGRLARRIYRQETPMNVTKIPNGQPLTGGTLVVFEP